MLVIADSSALVALAVCQCLYLLDELFEEVRVPQAVFNEVVIERKSHAETLREYLSEKVVTVDLKEFIIGTGGLGRGELEAMALFKKLHAHLLLIDDKRARKIARLNHVETIGSLSVLVSAKQKGLIHQVRPLIERLRESDIYISERLVKKVLWLTQEA